MPVILAAGALMLPAGSTSASPPPTRHRVYLFGATQHHHGVVSFRLRGVSPHTIRRATLRAGTYRDRLDTATVRRLARTGRLRVRLTRRMRQGLRREQRLGGPGARRRGTSARSRPVVELVMVAAASDAAKPAPDAPCTPDAGRFGIGHWPSGCWRPYADTSPFNTPLPGDPRLVSNSAQIVARLRGFGRIQSIEAGSAGTPDDFSTPIYYPNARDPLFKIHCARYECPQVEGARIRIPARAAPVAGGDGHLTTVDQASGWEYDLYDVQNPGEPVGYGGLLTVGSAGRTSITGSGVELSSSATASEFGRLGGIIRAQELAAGKINHALYLVAFCDSGRYVYPAGKAGRSCSGIGQSDAGAPPMGTRFQLDMSDAEIQALAVPTWKKTIITAMARYGLYLGDTGSGSSAIQAESGATYTSFGYEDRLVTFAKSQPGVSRYKGRYIFDIAEGVDWSRLRVIDPCVARGSC